MVTRSVLGRRSVRIRVAQVDQVHELPNTPGLVVVPEQKDSPLLHHLPLRTDDRLGHVERLRGDGLLPDLLLRADAVEPVGQARLGLDADHAAAVGLGALALLALGVVKEGEVVVVAQLLAGGYVPFRVQRHSVQPVDHPLLHLAVGLARVVHKAS